MIADDADDVDGCDPPASGTPVMRMILVRARPFAPERDLDADLVTSWTWRCARPPPRPGPPRRSEAVPAHSMRSAMAARTAAAIGSASITPLHRFIAACCNKADQKVPGGQSAASLAIARSRRCAAALGVAFREGASGPPPAMPMIGFLGSMSPDLYAYVVAAAPARPQETGYIKARMYRSSIDGRRANTMAPASAVDLVGHQVAVIVGNTSAALAAKSKRRRRFQSSSAVSSIRSGLALSPALTGPRGNDVGVSSMSGEFMAKHSLSEAACTSVTRCSCEWEISLRS
jgi:hypothetical protein